MINLRVLQWVLVAFFCFFCFSKAVAQENVTAPDCSSGVYGTDGSCNLGNPKDQLSTGNLIDTTPGVGMDGYADHFDHWHPSSGYQGNGTALWKQIVGINTALRDQGIRVDGVKYYWTFHNYLYDDSNSSTTATVKVTDDNGNVLYQTEYVYDRTNIGVNSVDELSYRPPNIDGSSITGAELSFHFRDYDGGYYKGHQYFLQDRTGLEFIYTADPCASDPLYDSSCPGYAEAWAKQQYELNCQANPLYDMGCPGYDQAYLNQQCSIDALYSPSCAGYASALFDNQCSMNPLYDAACKGFEEAFFEFQCSADPFYDMTCPGYADAYLDQQCSINTLYDISCPGYADAYFTQQCTLDVMYDATCPGYDDYILSLIPEPVEEEETATVATDTTTDTGFIDPVQQATNPSQTGDAAVDKVLRESQNAPPTAINPVEMASVPTVPSPPQDSQREERQPEVETAAESSATEEVASLERELDEQESESSGDVVESVEDGGNEEGSESGQDGDGSSAESSDRGDQPRPSASERRQSRENKIKELAKQKAMQLADTMSNAATLEAQQAVQATILALINFNPDFARYANGVPDGGDIYGGEMPDTTIPENGRGLLNGLANQILHNKMVDMQYQ